MSKSKNRSNHKEKLNQFKTQQMQNQQSTAQNLPEIKSYPTWPPDSTISMNGLEFEAIQQGLTSIQLAMQASQAIMTRNIINGTIKMDFEKLNPQTLQYDVMTDEEKIPLHENFNKMIEQVKNPKKKEEPVIVESVEEPKQEAKIIQMV